MKLKKRKKVGKYRGSSTHGWGARKKHISSGNRGGKGMSGTGKMAGHKSSLITHLYGNTYFGKQGVTSRSTKRRDNKIMNLGYIELNLETLKKKFGKKEDGKEILNLEDYKILGEGELISKIIIKAKAASESAIEKAEKSGSKIILEEVEKE
jgi:large subunit ribosomal protein L15